MVFMHRKVWSFCSGIPGLFGPKSPINGTLKISGTKALINVYNKAQKEIQEAIIYVKAHSNEPIFQVFQTEKEDIEDFYELNQLYMAALTEIGTLNVSDDKILVEQIGKLFDILRVKIALPDMPEHVNHIRIMTLHASKGLSSKLVVLISAIDQLIPFTVGNNTTENIEEQRRLFYVAITRCKTSIHGYPGKLIISSFVNIYAGEAARLGIEITGRSKIINVMASRFIKDLGKNAPDTTLG